MPEKQWYADSLFNAWTQAENIEKEKDIRQKEQSAFKTQEDSDSINNEQKAVNRPPELQELIFPGFEGLGIPNILTLKPK